MATVTTETRTPLALPRAIRRGLGRVDHRLRMLGMLRGAGTLALILAVGAAIGMAADVAFVLPMAARWAIWGAWVAAGAIALLAGVVRPLVRRIGWIELAAVAERGHPGLAERLTGAVGLLRGRPHGSPELIAALAEDAAQSARKLDLAGSISSRGAVNRLILGAVAFAIVAAPAMARPDPFADLWKRFLTPWADVDRVGRFVLEVEPGDKVVAIGSDLPISAKVRPRFGTAPAPEAATLIWTDAEGVEGRAKMVADPDTPATARQFAVTLPRVAGSLTYRVESGPAASRPHAIQAVEAPAVASLSARVEPPSYTKLPAAPARDPARVEAWEDSRITLEVAANKPLAKVEVSWPKAASNSEEKAASKAFPLSPSADGRRWAATVVADASGPFAFAMEDEYRIANRPEAPRRIAVRPDAPPTLAVAAPDTLKVSRPDDVLMLGVVAHDDFAVATAELHYAIERASGSTGAASGSVKAPLVGLGTRSARGEAALNLAPLGLKPGDTLAYRARVADNRPSPRGPNVVWSSTHGLRIVAQADSLLARQSAAERDRLQALLDAIKTLAAENRRGAEQLRFAADAARRGNGPWDDERARALAGREASARDVSDQLQGLARDFEEHPTFQPLARPSRQIAEVEAESARATLESARRDDDATKRLDDLKQADGRLGAVIARLDELQRKFDDLKKLDDDRRRLRALAEKQDDLAARAEEARAGDRAGLDPFQAEQEKLRRELDDLLRKSPALKAEALAAQAKEAAELAQRARAVAETQREEARKTADREHATPALKALAQKQRALEDDARRLALRVDNPLAENERARVNADALARAVEPIAKGDLPQARQRSEEAEAELNKLARDLDDARDDPRALARRLARREEAIKAETAAVIGEARNTPPQAPEAKAALAEKLKPLAERQEAVAKLAAAIAAPPEQKDVARNAAQATAKVKNDLSDPTPQKVERHLDEARDALHRLADALPDPNRRREQVRDKIHQARQKSEEVARELEHHLRDTAPKPGVPHDPAQAAAELARRVEPLATRQREAAAILDALEPERRAEPQRDRAAHRARNLADALDSLRKITPPAPAPAAADADATSTAADLKADEPRPLASWRVVGPFPLVDKPPFATDGPVDLTAHYPDSKGQPARWKEAPVEVGGVIDLARVYSKDPEQAAFAYTEVSSTTARPARMAVRSDDTLTVWLNGARVYDFQGNRSLDEPERLDVTLAEGTNRILVMCGNHNDEWQFFVALSRPIEGFRPVTDWQVVGVLANKAPAPFASDKPVDLAATHKDRNGQPAPWKALKPANALGGIDLAAHFANQDPGTAAFGHAEVNVRAARPARMLIGSNDTLTVWLNGVPVYDWQGPRSWAPDHSEITVPLIQGANRILVKCGNNGGPWMYSIALDEGAMSAKVETPADLARKEQPTPERLRQALPALQVEAQAALDRLAQKAEGKVPADDRAADLAADQHDAQAEQARNEPKDPGARAAEAADQRRMANALRNLDAPDAPLARAEAARRAENAVEVLADPETNPAEAREAVAHAAQAADALAQRLTDEQTPKARAEALARAQRVLNGPEAPADPEALARAEHAIADELALLPADRKADAVEAVAHAAAMADRAAKPDAQGPSQASRPDPVAAAEARAQAAKALDDLAARQLPGPADAPLKARAEVLAHAERALAEDLQAARDRAETAKAKAKAKDNDQRKSDAHARLDADLAPLAARQQALANAARTLPEPAKPGDAKPGDGPPQPLAEAKAAQGRAAEAMAQHDPGTAAARARDAAEALDRLAKALPADAHSPVRGPATARHQGQGQGEKPAATLPADPELGIKAGDAAEAADLARRQRHIREQVQAVLGDRVGPQQDLRDRAAALGRELADLRDRSKEIAPRAQGPAQAAAQLMGQAAPRAMGQAAEGLNQGRPEAALNAQRQAADLAEQAARNVEDLAAALRADAPEAGGGDLAAAQAAQREAASQLAQARDPSQAPAKGDQAAAAAAQAMHQAAKGLRAASRSRSRFPGQPGQEPGEGPSAPDAAGSPRESASQEPKGTRAGKADPDLAELQAALKAKTGRAWGELPGHLRTEILQMSQGRYRDDYSRLIQLYFREIAAGAPDTPDRGARP